MLKLLHIENIAIIEQCDIEFNSGFNVLTGETGAGKSIIIDSISAVLGERTTRELVRTGAGRAKVSAVFDGLQPQVLNWLFEQGFDECDELMLSREITQEGKSVCRINGNPVSVGVMKSLGSLILNIHGQHDSQALMHPESHAEFIDRFANLTMLCEYENEYSRYCALKDELKKLSMDEQEYLKRVDMLKYQIDELSLADIKPGELSDITARRAFLRDASRISESLTLIKSLFFGDDERSGIVSDIGGAERAMYSIDVQEIKELSDRVSELSANASDIADEVSKILDKIDVSPEEIERIETRFDELKRLCKKYGTDEDGLIALLSDFERELALLEHSDERRIEAECELDECENKCWELAQILFDTRRAAAKNFEDRVHKELSDLDMSKVKFKAEIKPRDELCARGADEIEFLIATNIGEPLKPIAKIASGGEMARIMLALKNVLAENDQVTTLIFDEVDSGVSGRAAQKVSEKLAELSKNKQILCVTHLPQMSAMADTHFKIEKLERNGRAITEVTELNESGRILELARIIGGTTITDTTCENARELIEAAENIKKELI